LPGIPLSIAGPLIPAAPADLIAALGKNDQKIYVAPSRGLVVIRQGASAGAGRQALSSFDNELWRRIMALYCQPSATAGPLAAASFQPFPNPATELLTLRQPLGTATVRLLDALGREVRRQPAPMSETTISVAALAPGLYTAQWLDGTGRLLASRKVARTL